MTTILSTKKLNPSQKQHLLHANLGVVDVDFITTESIDFQIPEKVIENAIFTSQKGVEEVLNKKVEIKNCFCVGLRTEKFLMKNNQQVTCSKPNAEELSNEIITNYSGLKFHYFCAEKRLDTLPNRLTENKVVWNEVPVYKTALLPKKYETQFDGVLFFSPSGVESYFSVNAAPEHSFCIGNTTAKSLKKYTKNYTIASQPSVENVIVKAIKHFKKND